MVSVGGLGGYPHVGVSYNVFSGGPMKRRKMSRSKSKRSFSKGSHTHKKNIGRKPMRGGIRL